MQSYVQTQPVTQYLHDNAGFQGSIGVTDKVCYPCYRSHLFILKQDKARSTDRDLKDLISSIEKNLPSTIETISDLIEAASNKVAVAVGNQLLEGNALLLPEVHNLFCFFAEKLSHHLKEEVHISTLVTSSNILSYLIATLQHHLNCSCKTYAIIPPEHRSDHSCSCTVESTPAWKEQT